MKSILLKHTFIPIFRNATRSLGLHSSAVSRTTLHAQRTSFHNSPFLQLVFRHPKRTPVRHLLSKRFNSTKPSINPTPHLNSPEPSLSLSQRFRKLSREYGWSALGVYLALSALDFPFCFLAVRWLGTDRIGHWEHVVLEWVWKVWRMVPNPFPVQEAGQAVEIEGVGKKIEEYGVVQSQSDEIGIAGYDHGVKEAEQRNRSENASIWTQLALAYAIHKSFIFIRIPIAAAVTPKVVKVLRGWGWDIGKRRPKGVKGSKKP